MGAKRDPQRRRFPQGGLPVLPNFFGFLTNSATPLTRPTKSVNRGAARGSRPYLCHGDCSGPEKGRGPARERTARVPTAGPATARRTPRPRAPPRPALSAAPGPLSARRPREPRVPLPLRRGPLRARGALTGRRDQVPKPPGERRSAGDRAAGSAEMQAQRAAESCSRPVPSNGDTPGPAPPWPRPRPPPTARPSPPARPQCACVGHSPAEASQPGGLGPRRGRSETGRGRRSPNPRRASPASRCGKGVGSCSGL